MYFKMIFENSILHRAGFVAIESLRPTVGEIALRMERWDADFKRGHLKNKRCFVAHRIGISKSARSQIDKPEEAAEPTPIETSLAKSYSSHSYSSHSYSSHGPRSPSANHCVVSGSDGHQLRVTAASIPTLATTCVPKKYHAASRITVCETERWFGGGEMRSTSRGGKSLVRGTCLVNVADHPRTFLRQATFAWSNF